MCDYGAIFLSHVYIKYFSVKYVDVQENYVDMQNSYVSIKHNFVDMQESSN